MEHSWGRNVTAYGLGSTGATLAARRLAGGMVVTNERLPGSPNSAVQWIIPADTQPDTPYAWHIAGPVTGNFPYGIPVEPDVPV